MSELGSELGTLWLIGFLVMTAAAVVWLAMVARVISWLRERHPAHYERFGPFISFHPGHMFKQMAFTRFVLSGQYRELNDSQISRICSIMRPYILAYLVGFVWLLVISIWGR